MALDVDAELRALEAMVRQRLAAGREESGTERATVRLVARLRRVRRVEGRGTAAVAAPAGESCARCRRAFTVARPAVDVAPHCRPCARAVGALRALRERDGAR